MILMLIYLRRVFVLSSGVVVGGGGGVGNCPQWQFFQGRYSLKDALKLVIANAKYVKSDLSTNSRI